jgi:hypothetical protein
MSGGGKGGSASTSVEIPAWLESAAKQNLARADRVAQLGYTPYYGPDVAAFSPMQMAAMQGTNQAASAFGLPGGDAMAGMPAPQTFAGGVQGYSSAPLYQQSIDALAANAPGQTSAMGQMFIDPITGAQPAAPFGSGFGTSIPANPLTVASPRRSSGRSSGMDAPMQPVGTGAGFTGLRDMFDGGGAGRPGATFSGGPFSGRLNNSGINPVAPINSGRR